MKRCKKVNVTVKTKIIKIYQVICPHCGCVLIDGFDKYTLRIKCYQCGEPIELIFDDWEDIMIGEVIRTYDEGKVKFGLLVEKIDGMGKVYIPCNDLLWELKKDELKNIPLIPQKVEINFIKK